MKVKEIMTVDPKACTTTTNLAEAASFMWDYDCGMLPVLAEQGTVVGLITDRDICIGGATKNRNLSNIAVEEIMTGKVYSCAPEDDVRTALETMQERKVRRLPVVAPDGTLHGILSISDITLNATETTGKKIPEISFGDLVQTYKAICAHALPAEQGSKNMTATA
ncbi:MAG: CBS domain-containing protein [Acidobacteriota bacterium]|nr:CBS domain-containing protein [Acidobacteriota bacterium]